MIRFPDIGFCLDVRRLLTRRASANLKNLFLENMVQPISVAIIVLFSYVNRSDVIAHRETLIYFSTLYAFWVGMFGSCQSINMELRNGEWSYWILGMGRSRYVHLCAICFVNFVFAVTQIVVFCGTILCFKFFSEIEFAGIGQIYGCFIDAFLSFSSDDGSPLFQMQGLLRCFLESYCPRYGTDVFCFSLFGTALTVASISGIGFGMLFSSSFKDPIVSLNISVGFVVVIGMLSYVGLSGSAQGKELKDLKSDFAHTILIQSRCKKSDVHNRGSGLSWMCTLSRMLPQRYFYNIGTLTFKRYIFSYEDENGNDRNEYGDLIDRYHPCELKAIWLKDAHSGETRSLLANDSRCDLMEIRDPKRNAKLLNLNSFDSGWEKDLVDVFTQERKTNPDYLNRMEIPFAFDLMMRTVWAEVVRILLIFAICFFVTIVQINRREVFHVLR